MAQGSAIRLGELGLRIDRDATSRIEDMSLEDVEGFLIKKAMAASTATSARRPRLSA